MNLAIEETRVNERRDYSHSPADAPGSAVVRHIPAEFAGLRLDQALARLYPQHSRSRLQAWLKEGRIRVDGAVPDVRRKVWGGEAVQADLPAVDVDPRAQAQDIALRVVFEDDCLLVIDKPAGLVVHPGSGNPDGTVLNALLHHALELAEVPRAGIVHRLDKDTSGLLVVAKTLAAQADLIQQLQARTVRRHYHALVHGHPGRTGVVDAPVGRHPVQRTRMAVLASGRPARTHYTVVARLGATTLLECRLETGRTHQIRVHMAHLGHPLVGDPVYGGRRKLPGPAGGFSRQALHAFRLGLRHPASAEDMHWEIPLADDFAALLASLEQF